MSRPNRFHTVRWLLLAVRATTPAAARQAGATRVTRFAVLDRR